MYIILINSYQFYQSVTMSNYAGCTLYYQSPVSYNVSVLPDLSRPPLSVSSLLAGLVVHLIGDIARPGSHLSRAS